jgi:nucleoside-diphosphate-sugar epimerase
VEPHSAYASSKLQAERGILPLADADFAPVAFRKGTIYGFSPRMRYDLVVNAFVKDALSKGELSVHYGGEMWRPLIDINDVARGYITALECDPSLIAGEVFNLSGGNHRISELALRTQRALSEHGVNAELKVDYEYRLVRTYRVSTEKIAERLNFQPKISVEESVAHMVREIAAHGFTDFSHPKYYNMEWMKLLEGAVEVVSSKGYVLSKPEWNDVVNAHADGNVFDRSFDEPVARR